MSPAIDWNLWDYAFLILFMLMTAATTAATMHHHYVIKMSPATYERPENALHGEEPVDDTSGGTNTPAVYQELTPERIQDGHIEW